MKNLSIPQSFIAEADTHYHRPITRRIYYNNCVVMVTNCTDCREELNRWIIEETYSGQLNTSTSTCPISVTENTQAS
jgi:hypothetical protein